ncbi:HIT family protein [Arcobacter sp. FWKO B]|uniref:HIT family protein n=1 Tax=Arcobacter sp. FWKO B TaxID=2593672 RepID=UPI0018A65EB8|nr:HIT domain-containing protein [Arcobacter sp. FWKO B]QOG11523.1 HIT domain-containing protein [Arcobacter sp. FWKO B]
MQKLYAPWRDEYVKGDRIQGCVFCHISKNSQDDESLGVLYRDNDCFIVMNRYPYSPGHFMIIPHFHTDALEELDPKVWMKISTFAQRGVEMLKKELNAKGVNIGMNLGAVGGAGIAEHIHLHLVPRWMGDTNFITTIGGTRVYSVDFDEIYQKLLKVANKYFSN